MRIFDNRFKSKIVTVDVADKVKLPCKRVPPKGCPAKSVPQRMHSRLLLWYMVPFKPALADCLDSGSVVMLWMGGICFIICMFHV